MSETNASKHLIITGRVQGVGYRAWTEREATRLGLSGWVRNRTDGTVEAVLHGPPDKVEALVEKARSGPFLAKVDDIAVSESNYNGPAGFETRPTA